ncbi:NADH-quinone oxidoreductase subunit NuoH [Planomonospora venezuelensis]|uniref:NADH-quinone oxidoreductase subunit H n=1 Tax=Planomonospora venezuelensis TaxID=1999 RepID=A0A841CZ52_PLAVE|nr:NADH-quinone oxidoreductase subunit NuoH [Planomonospora venezuelensis]MBB5961225.1 NADH-quinone oxidoreductase subunit H [Planomonospora venezuelensis]GIM99898.1 NADH-quinone oxidoreductase subunit H [Planomonospora venezuelensis]
MNAWSLLAAAPVEPALPSIDDFGKDPIGIVILKSAVIFIVLMLGVLFGVWYERKLISRMQNRYGPNRAGKFGLLQSVADGLKMGLKEDLMPRTVDKVIYFIAPVVLGVPAFLAFSVIPMGPKVNMFGVETPLQLTDLPVAVLLVLAMASIGVYGIVLAGWGSRSPYAMLGGLRASAQVVSYEIAMGLSFVGVFLFAGTLSTSGIVAAQASGNTLTLGGLDIPMPSWYMVLLLPSFLIYIVTMLGETNRVPFDLPEGEGELVGGFQTEYSNSLKFAVIMLAEYVNVFVVSAVSITLFMGGWRAPAPITTFWPEANTGYWPLLWFFLKMVLLFSFFIWARASLPRVRYDQLMSLGWKILIPVNLGWILLVATVRAMQIEGVNRTMVMILGALVVVGCFAIWLRFDTVLQRRKEDRAAQVEAEFEQLQAEPAAGGFPVPPLDLPHYRGVAAAAETRANKTAEVPSGSN